MSAGPRPSAYDVAGHYDEAYFADLAGRYRRRSRFARRRIANVFSLLPPLAGKRLLDIGCGMGTFAIETATAGASSIGADLAAAALPEAAAIARDVGAGAAFVRCDAARLPLPDATFDIALAADFTEHLDDDTLHRIAAELARVVRPGGTLVVYTPDPAHILERLRGAGVLTQEPSHIGLRSARELDTAFRRHGFARTQLRYLPSHLPGLDLIERAAGRWIPLLRRRIGLVFERTP